MDLEWTEVFNLRTGERALYTLPPHEVVVCAHEQTKQTRGGVVGDCHTWDYDYAQVEHGLVTVLCGDWTALIPMTKEAQALQLSRARETSGVTMTEIMTTRKCKARGCPDLVLVEGEFGYRCRITGLVPRYNPDGCPKVSR